MKRIKGLLKVGTSPLLNNDPIIVYRATRHNYLFGSRLFGWPFSWVNSLGEYNPVESVRKHMCMNTTYCVSFICIMNRSTESKFWIQYIFWIFETLHKLYVYLIIYLIVTDPNYQVPMAVWKPKNIYNIINFLNYIVQEYTASDCRP